MLPEHSEKRKWISIVITLLIALPLTLWGIYGIGEYGIALFILIPLLLGLTSTILFGYGHGITIKQSRQIGFLTLGIFTLLLFLCAIEGLICILMAAPFGLLLTWVGTLIGHTIITSKPNQSLNIILLFVILIPLTAIKEQKIIPDTRPVTTKIIIDAPVSVVWKNVVEFPELENPDEFIFNIGIAYPINATIEGQGIEAVRHCNFNTGSFVEPITTWEENELLAFTVQEQPQPLKELSFWDIDAPHLHDYFISKKGQFKLTELEDGKTELEGTTWYYHNIKPDFYWRLWSNYIIHKIHERVLEHIKVNSECH